ncbi:hypothetical protein WMF37_30270 [Sorangium sp. So ce291]|uniref:hypothetical protein n=1 Tax=Sorangium sp. So ce291 TaxID=3133294 RepID=UPI003F61591A
MVWAAAGAGCDGELDPPVPSPEPDKVYCRAEVTACARVSRNAQGELECQEIATNPDGSVLWTPRDGGMDRWTCFDPGSNTPEDACMTDMCSNVNPVQRPAPAPGQLGCRSFPHASERHGDAIHPGECAHSFDESSEPLSALPGPTFSPDFDLSLVGTGQLTVGDELRNVTLERGNASLKAPDPTCVNSPPNGCRIRINDLEIEYEDFDHDDRSIDDLTVFMAKPVDSFAASIDGTRLFLFSIPEGTEYHATGLIDGVRYTIVVHSDRAVTGTYDTESGEITFSLQFSGEAFGASVEGSLFGASDVVHNRAPVARAGEDLQVAATDASCAAELVLDASATTDTDGDLLRLLWSEDGATIGAGSSAPVSLPIGHHAITLEAFDAAGAYSYDNLSVTVTDETLPEFVAPAAEEQVRSCEPGASTVTLPVPQAVNPCSSDAPVVTGHVVSVNGAPASLPVVGGLVSLPAGTSVVEWTATNDNGSVTITQEVHVASEPTLFATSSLTIGDAVQVTADGGVRGTLMSVGSSPTTLRNDVRLGDVFSLPSVTVMDRAQLASLHHGGAFTLGNQVTIGAIVADSDFPQPQMPVLPAIGTGPGVNVEPDQTHSIAQGSYGNVVVKARAKLTLAAGVTTMERLELSPQAQLIVPANGGAQLFVRDQLVFQGSVTSVGPSGSVPAPLYLGFAGAEGRLSADFWGVAVAPNGRLLIETASSPSSPSARGRFYAQSLDVQAGVRLKHDDVFCSAP